MIIEKKITKIPYLISIAGSLLLIGLYTLSHTIGLPPIGLEQIGLLDLTVAAFQLRLLLVVDMFYYHPIKYSQNL